MRPKRLRSGPKKCLFEIKFSILYPWIFMHLYGYSECEIPRWRKIGLTPSWIWQISFLPFWILHWKNLWKFIKIHWNLFLFSKIQNVKYLFEFLHCFADGNFPQQKCTVFKNFCSPVSRNSEDFLDDFSIYVNGINWMMILSIEICHVSGHFQETECQYFQKYKYSKKKNLWR